MNRVLAKCIKAGARRRPSEVSVAHFSNGSFIFLESSQTRVYVQSPNGQEEQIDDFLFSLDVTAQLVNVLDETCVGLDEGKRALCVKCFALSFYPMASFFRPSNEVDPWVFGVTCKLLQGVLPNAISADESTLVSGPQERWKALMTHPPTKTATSPAGSMVFRVAFDAWTSL